MTEKRFTTVELPKPNRWGIWYDGAYLSTYQVCILLNEYVDVKKENEQLKASLYAEKTNTAEVVNGYSKQFKRHSAQFSFMMDLADDLGVDVTTLEASDD